MMCLHCLCFFFSPLTCYMAQRGEDQFSATCFRRVRHGEDRWGTTPRWARMLRTLLRMPWRYAFWNWLLCLVGRPAIHGSFLLAIFANHANHKQHSSCMIICMFWTPFDHGKTTFWKQQLTRWIAVLFEVKLIPPGLHYVYCSASAAEDIGICRSGLLFVHEAPRCGSLSLGSWEWRADQTWKWGSCEICRWSPKLWLWSKFGSLSVGTARAVGRTHSTCNWRACSEDWTNFWSSAV